MKTHRITGGGGVELHVAETGNPRGRPIVFLHGASQCGLQWGRQMDSSLTEQHRLVAVDMRGHGLSDKPRDGYGDSKQWADDAIPHAEVHRMANAGHAAFWDDAPAFNERLRAFCERL